jgi:hypothetical protein
MTRCREHGRLRLGYLTFPVGLASQFRLGSALSLGCDQFQAGNDGAAQLREDRQEEGLLVRQVLAAGDDQEDLLARERRGNGESPVFRRAFDVEPGDPGQPGQQNGDAVRGSLVILSRRARVPRHGAMGRGDRRYRRGDEANGLGRRRRLGQDERKAEDRVERRQDPADV